MPVLKLTFPTNEDDLAEINKSVLRCQPAMVLY